MSELRDLAVLFALSAGLEGEALLGSVDETEASLRTHLSALGKRGLLVRRGLLDRRWTLSEAGRAALAQFTATTRSSLPSPVLTEHPRRRVEPSLPFDASTSWKEAVCVNLAVEPAALRPLVPPVFELDLAGGSAWVSLTASRLEDFGVGRLPSPLRMNFYQATYRAHVRYEDVDGVLRRGCYFVRSETNSALMSATANLLPEFRSHRCGTAPIVMARDEGAMLLTVDTGADRAGKVVLALDEKDAPTDRLQPGSRFASLAAAREVIVDFLDAYAWEEETSEVYVLRIERGDWKLRVPRVIDAYLGYLEEGPFPPGAAKLDSVFTFRDVPYRWLPLVKESVDPSRLRRP